MNKITAPYNFVPLSKHVYYPDWSEEASHDLPFSDSEDGIIEVAIHTMSPLFTRDGDKSNIYSSHIMGADGKRHYFIPATTIKGMLRETVEIMSFGKMQEGKDFQNRYFGWRDVAGKADPQANKKYREIVSTGKPGWLKKEGDTYTFSPCKGELNKKPITEVEKEFPSYESSTSVWKTNASVKANGIYPVYPEVDKDGDTYRLVCTGKMQKKKHELLFPVETGEAMPVSNETIVAFKTLYANAPGFAEEKEKEKGCMLKALESGKEIPVFRVVIGDDVYLGVSKNFRIPYNYNVREQVEQQQKADPNKADLAETIFGYAGKEKSLKGRVTISHAFMEGTMDDSCLKNVEGILGTPKASYSPFYLKQDQSPYKTYDSKSDIAGRKLYRIHQGKTTTELPPKGENDNVVTKFCAIPEGQIFRLRIVLHNTRPIETGAILAALTQNDTEGVYFSLGLAKSFGYGKCKVRLDDIKLTGFNHDAKHYMHEFEKEMSIFTYSNTQKLWAETDVIKQYAKILSEHDDDTVRMMELEDYGKGKDKNSQFCPLTETNPIQIHSHLEPQERLDIPKKAKEAQQKEHIRIVKMELAEKYDDAKTHHSKAKGLGESLTPFPTPTADKSEEELLSSRKNGIPEIISELERAKNLYDEITYTLRQKDVPRDEENSKIEEIKKEIAEWESERTRIEERKKAIKLQSETLADVLEKRAGDGVSYSVKEFKVCEQKVVKWLRDRNRQALTPEEQRDLENTVRRLLNNPVKKEIKDLGNYPNGKIWPKLTEYLGKAKCDELHQFYTGKVV